MLADISWVSQGFSGGWLIDWCINGRDGFSEHWRSRFSRSWAFDSSCCACSHLVYRRLIDLSPSGDGFVSLDEAHFCSDEAISV